MASIFYASSDNPDILAVPLHAGTSSTAGDLMELRMGDGTRTPSRQKVLLFLEQMERWIINGGLGAGANLPPS